VYQPAVVDGNPLDTTTYDTLVQPHTHYTYDTAGNEITQTDADGNVTTFAYDQNGNQVKQTLQDGESESWAFNANSQVTSHTDFDGNTATYTYLTAGDPNAGTLQQVFYNPASGSGVSVYRAASLKAQPAWLGACPMPMRRSTWP
jgi:YD repeat-containing protein